MGGKETGCSGDRIWVGWSCLVGVCERGEVETGLLLTGCVWVGGRVGFKLPTLTLRMHKGRKSGVLMLG